MEQSYAVFVDIKEGGFNIDPKKIEEALLQIQQLLCLFIVMVIHAK